jgi:hypothetical protein
MADLRPQGPGREALVSQRGRSLLNVGYQFRRRTAWIRDRRGAAGLGANSVR